MSTTLEPRSVIVSQSPPQAARGWLVGPWFDALLIANLAWPLFVWIAWGEGFAGQGGLSFWQIYFVTTPHRWITLALVFLDRERFGERRMVFLLVAAAIVAICLGVRFSTGALTCLLAVDYVWNAWHFAAQHHGIYRIYGRLGEPAHMRGLALEKWSLRLFLLYVILRVAAATWPYPTWDQALRVADWFVLVIPVALLASELLRPRTAGWGRTVYLGSVLALYVCLLGAVHARLPALVLALATASALFHALEYLTLVGWSVQRRHQAAGGRMGLLGYLAPRWALALTIFLLILGASGWLLDQHWLQTWLVINVIVAFLHYAYDGLIWRQRPGAMGAKAA